MSSLTLLPGMSCELMLIGRKCEELCRGVIYRDERSMGDCDEVLVFSLNPCKA